MFLSLAAIGLASCNAGFKKGDGGLLYDVRVDKDGPKIKEGDFISVDVIAKTDADSVLFSTYETGHPSLLLMRAPQSKGDVLSGLKFLAEGDSATIKTNIDSVTPKGAPKPPFKGKYIVYEIKVEKVISKGNLSEQVFKGRYEAYLKSQADEMKKAEPIKIKKYIADKDLKVTTTPSGLNYVINTPGTGEKPQAGDTVAVYYVGRFLSGKVFDTNIKDEAKKAKMQINPMNPYKPIRFPLGVAGMIQGWNEGLLLLNKGSKATFVIPSSLAYGEQGNQQIQGFTPLVFDVELVDIIHPNPNAPKPVAPKPMAPQVVPAQPVRK